MQFTLEESCWWPATPLERFVRDATWLAILLSVLVLALWLRRNPRSPYDVLLRVTPARPVGSLRRSLGLVVWAAGALALVAVHLGAVALAVLVLVSVSELAGWPIPSSSDWNHVAAGAALLAAAMLAWLRWGRRPGSGPDVLRVRS